MNQDEYYKIPYSKILHEGKIGRISKYINSKLESKISMDANVVIELGAGQGQHLQFVKHNYSTYYETDLRIENLPKRSKLGEINSGKIVSMKLDAHDLSMFDNDSVDRILSNCLLIHLNDPEKALREWKRCITKGKLSISDKLKMPREGKRKYLVERKLGGSVHGGVISFYVPCEPGILLRTARHLTTVRKSRRLGYNHLSFHYREHLSYFTRLDLLITETFNECIIERDYWPFRIPTWNFNLGVFYRIHGFVEKPGQDSQNELTR